MIDLIAANLLDHLYGDASSADLHAQCRGVEAIVLVSTRCGEVDRLFNEALEQGEAA